MVCLMKSSKGLEGFLVLVFGCSEAQHVSVRGRNQSLARRGSLQNSLKLAPCTLIFDFPTVQIQMRDSGMGLYPVQGSVKVEFPISRRSVNPEKVKEASVVVSENRMPQMHDSRMRKGLSTDTGFEGITRQGVEIVTAGSRADEAGFFYQITYAAIIFSARIAEGVDRSPQNILKPVFAPSDFSPRSLFIERW